MRPSTMTAYGWESKLRMGQLAHAFDDLPPVEH